MKFKIIISVLIVLFIANMSLANESIIIGKTSERDYQEVFCNEMKGTIEVVMIDKTRCDCLTEYFAIELDYAKKWYEGVMQALHYSELTNKNAGLALIIKSENDWKYIKRALRIINSRNLPINVWFIKGY